MKNAFLLFVSVWFSTCFLAQNQYFVAANGSDNNNGAINSPWRHIQYGVNQMSPGDFLNIRGGVYEEKVDIDVSGALGQFITLRAYQGEDVVLDAINSDNETAIIYTDNDFVRVEGLHLTNNIRNFSQGFFIINSHHIELINNKVSNIFFSADPDAPVTTEFNASPMYLLGEHATLAMHDILIQGNEIFNCRTGFSENISLGGNIDGFLIEDNYVHDNKNIGIDMTGNYGECPNPVNDHPRNGVVRNNLIHHCESDYSNAAGIYVDGGKDIVVENNVSHHNGYGGEIGCEENGFTENITFRNNLFYLNYVTGMHLGGYDVETTGIVRTSKVYNNTFYKNDINNWFGGEIILTLFEDGEISNNIFYVSAQNVLLYGEREQANLVFDYNLVYTTGDVNNLEMTLNENTPYQGLSNFYTATGYGANATYGDPLFVSPDGVNPDFHIMQNSAAIDAGDPGYIVGVGEVDLDGQSRINNGTIDCGADEFSSGVTPTIEVLAKVFLQGAYSFPMMTDILRSGNHIPLTEPYSALEFQQVLGGGESTTNSVLNTTGANAIVDWVLLELRNVSNPAQILSTKAALVQRDGDIVATDGFSSVLMNLPDGASQVYLAVRHRNHLGIRSESEFNVNSAINIDFTDALTIVHGTDPQVMIGGKMAMYSGDANRDGQVNFVDKNDFWRVNNSQPYNYATSWSDFDMNGAVNAIDLNNSLRINAGLVDFLE